MPKILTDEEVKKVRHSLVTVSLGNIHKMIRNGGIKPTQLSNGYMVSFSLDVIRENLRILHLSVSNGRGDTDIVTAELIAKDVIGDDVKTIGPQNVKNVIHFMKLEKENTMTDLMKD